LERITNPLQLVVSKIQKARPVFPARALIEFNDVVFQKQAGFLDKK
jgi:hypothetical protein